MWQCFATCISSRHGKFLRTAQHETITLKGCDNGIHTSLFARQSTLKQFRGTVFTANMETERLASPYQNPYQTPYQLKNLVILCLTAGTQLRTVKADERVLPSQ